MTHKQEHPTKSTHDLTRRDAITAAASAIVMAACACHGSHEEAAQKLTAAAGGTTCNFDGFGEPYDEGIGKTKEARALLALWLLFVTRRSFVYDQGDTSGVVSKATVAQITQWVSSLKYLPSNTLNAQNESQIVRALADAVNGGFTTTFSVSSQLVQPTGDGSTYKVGYGAALLAVQELFGFLGTGTLKGNVTSVYSGPPEQCPKTQKTVLSIAAEQ